MMERMELGDDGATGGDLGAAAEMEAAAAPTGADIVRSQAHLLRPREKLTLTEWAIRYRGYDPECCPGSPS
jgi:hypothetical protein